MPNATIIVPIGPLNLNLARRVSAAALTIAQRRRVIVSLQSTERYSWDALHALAELLRASVTPFPIRLACALPRTRALLRELGVANAQFTSASNVGDPQRSFGIARAV